jgi:predicted MFS family arabinose efflux permease
LVSITPFVPALGGCIAEWIGYQWTFLLLGGFGLISAAIWLAFKLHVKHYQPMR